LFLKHKSKDKSNFGREPHPMSSGMMEVVALEKCLAEAKEMDVNISRLVADADAGIKAKVKAHGIPRARCCNHGGKNSGNAGIEIGKNNSCCDCPVKLTKSGKPYKSGAKEHLPITKDIASRVQAAFGAQTVVCDSDQDAWLVQVPQILNHYFDDHLPHSWKTVEPVW
jgi:hypothetical protein